MRWWIYRKSSEFSWRNKEKSRDFKGRYRRIYRKAEVWIKEFTFSIRKGKRKGWNMRKRLWNAAETGGNIVRKRLTSIKNEIYIEKQEIQAEIEG